MWQFQPMATYNHTSCYATYNSLAGLWYLIALSFPYIPTCIQLLGQNQIGCIFHVTTIQKMEKMIPLKLYDISGYIFFLFNSLNVDKLKLWLYQLNYLHLYFLSPFYDCLGDKNVCIQINWMNFKMNSLQCTEEEEYVVTYCCSLECLESYAVGNE